MSVVVLKYAEQVASSEIIRAFEIAARCCQKPMLMRSGRVNHDWKVALRESSKLRLNCSIGLALQVSLHIQFVT